MSQNQKMEWSSVEELAANTSTVITDDVPDGTDGQAEMTMDGVSRRTFLGLMGAGTALAGVGLSGCIRKPVTPLVPHRDQPEDQIPGKPMYYASAYQAGVTVQGVLVESHDGRPTKIEGNPSHEESLGATTATVQASVLGLYDLDRSTTPKGKGEAPLAWEEAWKNLDAFVAGAVGKPVAVVTRAVMSPTERRLLATLKGTFAQARFFIADALYPAGEMAAAGAVGGNGAYALTHLENATIIASFDSDFLGREHSSVRNTKKFSSRRKVDGTDKAMNRLYSVESTFTITGAMADHRIRARGSDVGLVLAQLASALSAAGVVIDQNVLGKLPPGGAPANDRFVAALAKDLTKPENKGQGVVLVGYRQPAWVHALALAINQGLGAFEANILTWHRDPTTPELESSDALAAALASIDNVLVLGANPAHAVNGAAAIAAALANKNVVHAGLHYDETAKLSSLHIPVSHWLESWGDLVSLSGVAAIVQPLIAPLHYTPSQLEVLARVATGKPQNGYALVRDTWKAVPGWSEKTWRSWLHDGYVKPTQVPPAPEGLDWAKAGALMTVASGQAGGGTIEVDFHIDNHRLDGRYANNAWLQEAPDPMTKVTWDNPALLSKKTADKLGLETGDLATVTVNGAKVEIVVKIMPGQADDVVGLMLGHGRKGVGKIAELHGFDVHGLWGAHPGSGWFTTGEIAAANGTYMLADVQGYGNSANPGAQHQGNFGPGATPKTSYDKGPGGFVVRPHVFQSTLEEYKADPSYPDKILDKTFNDDEVGSLMYPERPEEKRLPGGARKDKQYLNGVHQWGLSIDLNLCTGCNACMLACQAENNIPVVGKEKVFQGREMHWIRLDRYFTGDENDPQAVLQPMPCQQCETAPCEAVCPVKATAHSPEGLNDMAYNRCIGTRYCLNNCPYKIRRFNFFNYNINIHPLTQMQKNPDVTIRFRGVMEKCTYCVQRINLAKIEAKVHGDGKVPDGAIQTACQQVCPADAIVFGNIDDPNAKVTQLKSLGRTYQVLRELNTRPRTTYMAKVRNTNPDLV